MGLQSTYLALMNIDYVRDRVESALASGDLDVALALRLCDLCRQKGCGVLLADTDVDGFHLALTESANAYLRILDAAEKGQRLDPYYLTRTRAEPLFDALAAGEMELAKSIAQRLPVEWNPELEPAEDSHFVGVVAALVVGEPPAQQQLEAMGKIVGEGPRWEMAKSLVELDSTGFEAALSDLIEERKNEVDARRKGSRMDPYQDATTANVFVYGAALVRLARFLGMETATEYPLVPDIALS